MQKGFIFCCMLLLTSLLLSAQDKSNQLLPVTQKEKAIVTISACTAKGNMTQLRKALNEGLDAGLSISEVKEMLVQLYAYTGFPKSLNALHSFMAVLDERRAKGVIDSPGAAPSPFIKKGTMLELGTANQTALVGAKVAGAVYDFAPAIDRFLKEHLFGAIFSRDILDWKTREWVTISALAVIEGNEAQLRSHFGVGLHNGLTIPQLSALVTIIATQIDQQRGRVAGEVLQSFIEQKPFKSEPLSWSAIFPLGQKIQNENFSGAAWLNQLILSDSSNTIQVGNVTFEPGARTNWHYHPAGQILIILDGLGYYQEHGKPKRFLRKGDVVKCPPNVPHWHGASADEKLVQLAITDTKNGATVWQQAVTEGEYDAILEK